VLKIKQVAERLNCSPQTVYQLIESGKLSHYRCPGIRVTDEDLGEYLESAKRDRETDSVERKSVTRPRLKHVRG
jgi:excisionase family DNA binding protein